MMRIAWTVVRNLVCGTGPASRFEILLGHVLGLIVAALALLVGFHLAGPLLRVAPRPSLATVDGVLLLPDDDVVMKIFNKLADVELNADLVAKKQFPDHRWSQQDRRAEIMHNHTRNIAKRRKMSVSLIYLIHQKGISEHWPGKDGKPLEVEIVPRKSREY